MTDEQRCRARMRAERVFRSVGALADESRVALSDRQIVALVRLCDVLTLVAVRARVILKRRSP